MTVRKTSHQSFIRLIVVMKIPLTLQKEARVSIRIFKQIGQCGVLLSSSESESAKTSTCRKRAKLTSVAISDMLGVGGVGERFCVGVGVRCSRVVEERDASVCVVYRKLVEGGCPLD